MVIAFFGYSSFCESEYNKEKVIEILESISDTENFEFYLGGYGGFDRFAYECCKHYKKLHGRACLYFITPYTDPDYIKNALAYKGINTTPLYIHHSKTLRQGLLLLNATNG